MQYLDNNLAENNLLSNDEILLETPIGWSSTCFNETIGYYKECNSINSSSNHKTTELEDTD